MRIAMFAGILLLRTRRIGLPTRRHLLVTVTLTLAAVGCAAPAQDGVWAPTRPIEFVVAAGPGGGSDQLARTVQGIVQKHKLIDSAVIVTNKGGGSGSEAFVYAKGAAGDPHKVVFATNNVWLLPLGAAVGYGLSDLQPVAAVAFDEFMLWVNSTAPYRDVTAFLDAARGATKLAIAGTASKDTDQVLVRQIEKVGHVAFAYVPFRSGSEVAVQLAGGHVAANVNNPQENMGQWRAGAVRPLCVFSKTRLNYADAVTPGQSWADIPTCTEAGLPIERYQMPRTIWLPRGVTDGQVAFYRALLAKVRETGEWKAWLRRGSQSDAFLTGPELTDYIAADERWLRGQFAEDGWLVK
jgi:tripartite-type tricarboxylate transporter receptor subunit TctC